MNEDTNRVVVTGMGAICALGTTVDEYWERLLAGCGGIKRLPRFLSAGLPATTGGDIESVPYDLIDRDQVIANHAIEQSLLDASLKSEKAGFIWGAGLDTFHSRPEGAVHRLAGACFHGLSQKFKGPRRMVAAACASGTQSIGEAYCLIKTGRCESCVAGGSSVILTPFYLLGFAALQVVALDREGEDPAAVCKPFDCNRRGFVLADGAGALVLESICSAKKRNAVIHAEIIGFGVSQDAFDLVRPSVNGIGIELSVRRALDDAELSPHEIDAVNAHGTGTFEGDVSESKALRKLFGKNWKNTPVSSVKGAIGHTMAASGALEAVVSIKTCITGIVPHTINLSKSGEDCKLDHVVFNPRETGAETVLSISSGMGGQNSALIFRRMQ